MDGRHADTSWLPGGTVMVNRSDEELVAALRSGDDSAFEAIHDRYARGILAFCVNLLRSRETAEDALQLTFASAYPDLRRGQQPIVLRPWLYTVARNSCQSWPSGPHGPGGFGGVREPRRPRPETGGGSAQLQPPTNHETGDLRSFLA